MKKINWSEPLQLIAHGVDDYRKVMVISQYPNGWARVGIEGPRQEPIMFDEFGNYVMADENDTKRGRALSIRNAPKIDTLYLRLSKYMSPTQTSVNPTPQSGTACVSVKLTLTEGIVTGVELDRANIEPIERIQTITGERIEL